MQRKTVFPGKRRKYTHSGAQSKKAKRTYRADPEPDTSEHIHTVYTSIKSKEDINMHVADPDQENILSLKIKTRTILIEKRRKINQA